jgi:hypothetical protein
VNLKLRPETGVNETRSLRSRLMENSSMAPTQPNIIPKVELEEYAPLAADTDAPLAADTDAPLAAGAHAATDSPHAGDAPAVSAVPHGETHHGSGIQLYLENLYHHLQEPTQQAYACHNTHTIQGGLRANTHHSQQRHHSQQKVYQTHPQNLAVLTHTVLPRKEKQENRKGR